MQISILKRDGGAGNQHHVIGGNEHSGERATTRAGRRTKNSNKNNRSSKSVPNDNQYEEERPATLGG